MMAGQTSGMMFSYHQKSAAPNAGARTGTIGTQTAGVGAPSDAQIRAADMVTQDKVWKQAVGSERRCLENWSENWGFMTEFDSKGNPIEKEELPEKVNMFSDAVPNTNSGNYGSRLDTEAGRTMRNLEAQFFSQGKRQKLDSEMVCY